MYAYISKYIYIYIYIYIHIYIYIARHVLLQRQYLHFCTGKASTFVLVKQANTRGTRSRSRTSYVSIRQHTSAYVSIRQQREAPAAEAGHHTLAYVIR